MIQIVLADDHLVIRKKMRLLLAQQPEWHVSGETGDGLEAVRLAKELKPDVLVTDLAMPGLHGLEVARRVHRQSPRTRIVVVSIHADEPYVRQALCNGVLCFVRKDEVGRCLLPAIRSALAGDRYLSPALAELAFLPPLKRRSQPKPAAYESLNQKERSALQLMAQGYTNLEIGLYLRLTVARAGHLRDRVMQRLGLRNEAELATFIRKMGLAA